MSHLWFSHKHRDSPGSTQGKRTDIHKLALTRAETDVSVLVHRVEGTGETVEAEVARVKGVGGWIEDGRVCDVLAVSRAFGDAMFKGDGLPDLLQFGIE